MKRGTQFKGVIVVCLLFGMATAVAACNSGVSEGSVKGNLRIVTEAVQFRTDSGSGKVTIRQGDQTVASVVVGSGHSFSISVSPGTYAVTATAPNAPCESGKFPSSPPRVGPVKVVVSEGSATAIAWTCVLPAYNA